MNQQLTPFGFEPGWSADPGHRQRQAVRSWSEAQDGHRGGCQLDCRKTISQLNIEAELGYWDKSNLITKKPKEDKDIP